MAHSTPRHETAVPGLRASHSAYVGRVLLLATICGCALPVVHGVLIHPSEVPVLQELQAAWGRTFAGWDNSTDCSKADHLSCDAQGCIISLDISWSNQISGPLPPVIGNLTALKGLNLILNNLNGTIPSSLGKLTNLQFMYLARNNFSGSIPAELGSLTNLTDLLLDMNNLSGSITETLTNLKSMTRVNLGNNSLTGSIPQSLSVLTSLSYLILYNNQLNGTITESLSALKALVSLNLDVNWLSGTIPPSLGALTRLSSLGLEWNLLSGSFPITFLNLSKLSFLTADETIKCPLPTNSCIARHPAGGWAGFCKLRCKSFCSTCYQGGLAIPTIPSPPSHTVNNTNGTINPPSPIGNNSTNKDGGTSPPPSSSSSSSAISTGALVGIVCGAVGAIALVSTIVFCICKQRNNHTNYGKHEEDAEGGPAFPREDGCGSKQAGQPVHEDSVAWVAQLFRPMTLAELRKATNNFSEKQLLGRGGFGVVYLGHGPDGQKWAVKRSIKTSSRVDNAFKQEVLKLSRLTSPHLVSLLGFCIEKTEQIVVYEFVENGSLRTALHESNSPLSFKQRLTIACGVAQGLHYLHDQRPSIVHRDIKPDNILLDTQWQAKVADFGLLRALDGQQTIYTIGAGTPGYVDPEYWTSLRLTTASDVYSFGMVLLEMFTGRNLLVDSQQDLQHAGELQQMHHPMPMPIPLGTGSIEWSSSSNSGTGQDSLVNPSLDSTCITRSSDSSSGAGFPLGVRNPLDADMQKEAIPLRAWVVSVQKYRGKPAWLSVVLDPLLQPGYLPVNVMEEVLQIAIDCSARESSSRPDIRIVEERLLQLAAQLESPSM